MKAKFGAIVTTGSGKLGGQMFSQTPSGVVMKTVGSYIKNKTPRQNRQRINTALIMALYSQIDADARAKWDWDAKFYYRLDVFGQSRTINGFQLMSIVNQNRFKLNLAPIVSPSGNHVPTFPQPVQIFAETTSLTLVSTVYNSEDIIEIWATPPLGNGITSVKKRMRYLTSVTDVQLAEGIDIIAEYQARFGVPTIDNNIHIGVKTISNVSYYGNGLLYSSSAKVGIPSVETPFFRIRGGETDYTSTNGGLIWRGGTSGDGWTYVGGTYFSGTINGYTALPSYISLADRVPLFMRERWGIQTLTLDAPPGYYLMRYYFVEAVTGGNSVGFRVFNVLVNGNLALANLDAVALFTYRILGYVEHTFLHTGGNITVQTQAVVQNPVMRAIEIISLTH